MKKQGKQIEIERRFLAGERFEEGIYKDCPKKEIAQAYISTSPTIRLRKSNENYILTIKGETESALVRNEFELGLSKEQFDQLSQKLEGRILEKTRYLVKLEKNSLSEDLSEKYLSEEDLPERDGLIAEVDIFKGFLEGFVIIEVEFETVEESQAFIPPAWFGKEITEDRRFANSSLATAELEDVKQWITSLCKGSVIK